MSTRTAAPGAVRLFALIEQLEQRRRELDALIGPMAYNGLGVRQLEAALISLSEVIELLRGVMPQ